MSIITTALPDCLTVSGKECKIKTDFKTWLKFSEIISGGIESITDTAPLFCLVFEEIPPNFYEGLSAMFEFYTHNAKTTADSSSDKSRKNVFDFDYDGNLIYAAFLQQYNIDLCNANMHWWQFKSLFDSLSEETQFIKVVQYRMIDLSKIKDKEQKKFYRKMKSAYALPDKRSEKQKESDMNEVLSGFF